MAKEKLKTVANQNGEILQNASGADFQAGYSEVTETRGQSSVLETMLQMYSENNKLKTIITVMITAVIIRDLQILGVLLSLRILLMMKITCLKSILISTKYPNVRISKRMNLWLCVKGLPKMSPFLLIWLH